MPTALIIGHKGQDGTYLTQLLRRKAYRIAATDRESIDSDVDELRAPLDIGNAHKVQQLVAALRPDEIYFLAAFHHSSEDSPVGDGELISESFAVNTLALNHVLNAMVAARSASRLFYASSSRVFGEPPHDLQDESTPLNPVCAYGISKEAAMRVCRYYRQRGVYVSCGIFYNHESPLRPPQFISRKVVQSALRISRGSHERLVVGDLGAQVDWGYAPDYADAVWRILQLDSSDDFVIGTGRLHTVRDLVETAFRLVGLDWRSHVTERAATLRRKASATPLRANSRKLRDLTGWEPTVSFEQMIAIMMDAEKAEAIQSMNTLH